MGLPLPIARDRTDTKAVELVVTTFSTLLQGRPCGRPPPAAVLGRQSRTYGADRGLTRPSFEPVGVAEQSKPTCGIERPRFVALHPGIANERNELPGGVSNVPHPGRWQFEVPVDERDRPSVPDHRVPLLPPRHRRQPAPRPGSWGRAPQSMLPAANQSQARRAARADRTDRNTPRGRCSRAGTPASRPAAGVRAPASEEQPADALHREEGRRRWRRQGARQVERMGRRPRSRSVPTGGTALDRRTFDLARVRSWAYRPLL